MIVGCWHEGSGLGDQLFRYITVRSIAERKSLDFGMIGEFKGDFFLEFDKGRPLLRNDYMRWQERELRDSEGIDVRSYDPEINFVGDNTIIDGSFEDDKYWRFKLPEIDKWLSVQSIAWLPKYLEDDLCVIGFRGGEYYSDSDLGLPKEYYHSAISKMLQVNPNMRFEVHTDDEVLAKNFFPEIPIVPNGRLSHSKHANMGYNWRAMRYAKYAIIANSSFYIIPRILNSGMTIAPRYWARRNTKKWARPACYYPEFTYA